MMTLIQLTRKIGDIRGFSALLETYEDLAAKKMQKIRGEIFSFREYAKALTQISEELEVDVTMVIRRHEKKKAVVLISSDKGLYGNAFEEVGDRFADYLAGGAAEAFVVGSLGARILDRHGLSGRYTLISSDNDALTGLWGNLGGYQEVDVFYLRYENLAMQAADVQHLSGDLVPKEEEKYEIEKGARLKYLYEPSVSGVADVFSKEILSFLAEQTMKESDLSKYAARLMYLDNCLQKNSKNLSETMRQKFVLTKRRANKRQNARIINYLAGAGR